MVMGFAALLGVLASGHVAVDSEGAFGISGLMSDTPIALQAEPDGLSDIVTITAIEPGMERLGIVLRFP